jgi:hypothetical protein
MQKPAQLYQSSPRKYEGLADVNYPFHDKTVTALNVAGSVWAIKGFTLVPFSLAMMWGCGKSKTMCG